MKHKHLKPLLLAGIGIANALFFCASSHAKTPEEMVALWPALSPLAPPRGDVVMSVRFPRQDSLGAVTDFGADRVVWIYAKDDTFVKQLARKGIPAGGTINANPEVDDDSGYARGLEGKILVAPWMASWGAKWTTSKSSSVLRAHLKEIRRLSDMGISSIQFDDAEMESSSERWGGGDFSEASVDGFPEWLASHTTQAEREKLGISDTKNFSIKRYLKNQYSIDTSAEYLSRKSSIPLSKYWSRYLISNAQSYATKLISTAKSTNPKLAFSLNLYDPVPSEERLAFVKGFDYVIAEAKATAQFEDYLIFSSTLRSLGLGYVATAAKASTDKQREFIRTMYAMGANPLVPWDIWVPPSNGATKPRFFGKPEEYTDLYGFAKKNRAYLDDFDCVPQVSLAVPVAKYDHNYALFLAKILSERNICFAFVPHGGIGEAFDATSNPLLKAPVVGILPGFSDAEKRRINSVSGIKAFDLAQSRSSFVAAVEALPSVKVESCPGWRAFVNYSTKQPGTSAIHLVSTSGAADTCKGSLLISRALLPTGQITAQVRTLANKAVDPTVSKDGEQTRIKFNSPILDWGLVVIK